MKTEDKQQQWAEFRFGVIAPLVCRRLDEAQRRIVRQEILNQVFVNPEGKEQRVAERTLREWVARHQLYGLAGLKRLTRSDKGVLKALSVDIIDSAYNVRKDLRSRSISSVLSHLRNKNVDTSTISKTTLNRYLNTLGVEKEKAAAERGTFQRWQKEHANDLWQADTSRGIWIPDPANVKEYKQTRLVSFIDDATRVVTHAEYYWDEQLPSLLDCFRKALLKRGKPRVLLCDNAFIYHSRAMKSACAKLGIELKFCREYFPEGKGKIEKSYATFKSRFYEEAKHAGIRSLDELNKFWFAWLTREYHHQKHSALNATPIERWAADEAKGFVQRVSTDEIRRALMIKESRQTHKRTATIRLHNRVYQLKPEMAGKEVDAVYEPYKLGDSVEIWCDGVLVQIANEVRIGANIDFSRMPERNRTRRQNHQVIASARDYKNALIAGHQSEACANPREYMAESEFKTLVAQVLEKEINEDELNYLSSFYVENMPMTAQRIQQLLVQIVGTKGKELHIRSYCEHVREGLNRQRS